MWRWVYLFLILVRLYFALSPSYLHPDENFQGPEVIAGRIFSYPVHLTWEFTAQHPIRSAFPLWLVYGLPMYILGWIWEGVGHNEVSPTVVYWMLRILMFTLSFVLEDWAIQELVQSPRQQRVAILLTASSYVTWTFQTHTFSNAVETLVLAWALVLIGRIVEDKKHSGSFAASVLSFLIVIGTFNRITFPAFLVVPALQLLSHFKRKPLALLSMALSGAFWLFVAVATDTTFYSRKPFSFRGVLRQPTITPLSNLRYNSSSENLAKHGLHPYYQHLLANLPQLLGPALLLLLFSWRKSVRLVSAISGILILSLIPHQEARFLVPAVPLILSSVKLPKRFSRAWIFAWVSFNLFMGILMGIFHQGGVMPVQMHLATASENVTHTVWWKTYSPPLWLLNGVNERMVTRDMMGVDGDKLISELTNLTRCNHRKSLPERADWEKIFLVAPRSAAFLDQFISPRIHQEISLEEVWSYRRHLNLDDLDFGEDGVWATLNRVVGGMGLVVWRVHRICRLGEGRQQ